MKRLKMNSLTCVISCASGILQRLASAAPGIEAPKALEDLSIQSATDRLQSVVYAGKKPVLCAGCENSIINAALRLSRLVGIIPISFSFKTSLHEL